MQAHGRLPIAKQGSAKLKNKPHALILYLFLSACVEPFDAVSAHGVKFSFEGEPWQQQQIDEQEAFVIDALLLANVIDKATLRNLRRLHINVVEGLIACPDCINPTTPKAGIQRGDYVTVTNMGCPFNSPFMHETLHFLQRPFIDYAHKDLLAWGIANSAARSCQAPTDATNP